MGTRRKCSKFSFRMNTTHSSSGVIATWISLRLFLGKQTSGDDSWYMAITINELSEILFLYLDYSTSWQDLFICGIFLLSFFLSFFLLTRQKHSSFFSSFSFLKTRSTLLIQLPVAGILCRELKIHGNILFISCLIYVYVCCWCHRSHILWIRLRPLSILGKATRKDPDTIGYTTHI